MRRRRGYSRRSGQTPRLLSSNWGGGGNMGSITPIALHQKATRFSLSVMTGA